MAAKTEATAVPRASSPAHTVVVDAEPPAQPLLKRPPSPMCIWGNTAAGMAAKARHGSAHCNSFIGVRHSRSFCKRAPSAHSISTIGPGPLSYPRRLASPPRAFQAVFRALPDSDAGLQAALKEFHRLSAACAEPPRPVCDDSELDKYRDMMAAHLRQAGDTAAALKRHNDGKAVVFVPQVAPAVPGIVAGAAAAVPAAGARVPCLSAKRARDDDASEHRPSQAAHAAAPSSAPQLARNVLAPAQFMTRLMSRVDPQLTASRARCMRTGLPMVAARSGPTCVGCVCNRYAALLAIGGSAAATPVHTAAAVAAPVASAAVMLAVDVAPAPLS